MNVDISSVSLAHNLGIKGKDVRIKWMMSLQTGHLSKEFQSVLDVRCE